MKTEKPALQAKGIIYENRVDSPLTRATPHRSGRAAFPHPTYIENTQQNRRHT